MAFKKDIERILRQIEQLYQSMNIYNAIYVKNMDNIELDNLVIQSMKEEQYPITHWYENIDFLNAYRILVMRREDMHHLQGQIDVFTLAMTTNESIFNELLEDPICENVTLVKL